MKNVLIFFLTTLSIFTSCIKNENIESILIDEDVPWLNDLISDTDQYVYYNTATYQNQSVYVLENCSPNINYVAFVYNTFGENIGLKSELINELTEETLFWKPPNSKCDF